MKPLLTNPQCLAISCAEAHGIPFFRQLRDALGLSLTPARYLADSAIPAETARENYHDDVARHPDLRDKAGLGQGGMTLTCGHVVAECCYVEFRVSLARRATQPS